MATLQEKFVFYEQEADLQQQYLPVDRIIGEDREAKQIFELFKHATDGMRSTGGMIIEKLVSDGRITESNRLKDKINQRLNVVAGFREINGDVLSFTSSWHPGQRSQIDGTELYRAPSEGGTHRSFRSDSSENRKAEERRLQAEIVQAKADQEAL